APHLTQDLVAVVVRIRKRGRHWSLRWLIETCRRYLAQRFMRPFGVVLFTEGLKPRLLSGWVGSRRLARLSLERAMHPLVPTVLLRLARLDPFQPDPQLCPAHGDAAETACTNRSEGRAIVAAYRARQPIAPEQRIHLRLDCRTHWIDDPQTQQ